MSLTGHIEAWKILEVLVLLQFSVTPKNIVQRTSWFQFISLNIM